MNEVITTNQNDEQVAKLERVVKSYRRLAGAYAAVSLASLVVAGLAFASGNVAASVMALLAFYGMAHAASNAFDKTKQGQEILGRLSVLRSFGENLNEVTFQADEPTDNPFEVE